MPTTIVRELGTKMNRSVLVVEDNPDNSKLLCWMLEDWDYAVIFADSAEEALSVVEEQRFDLILMDINLPGMGGEEATRQLRKLPSQAGVPIIAVTAHALKSEIENIMAAGFDALITKPIDEEELFSAISKLLE